MKNGIVRVFLTVHIHPLPIKREQFLFINVYITLIDKYRKIIYICNMNKNLIKYTAKELEDLCEKYGLRYSYKYDRLYIQAIGLFRPTAWLRELGTGSWNSFVHFDRMFDLNGELKFYITQYSEPKLSTDDTDNRVTWRRINSSIMRDFPSKEDFYAYLTDFIKKINEQRIAYLEQQKLKSLQEDF